MRVLGLLLQLVPLAAIVFLLFNSTAPPNNPSGMVGVAVSRPLGSWYAFPLSIALGLSGILAGFSRVAAAAAATLTVATLVYGLRLLLPGTSPGLGGVLVALSVLSLAGWVIPGDRSPSSGGSRVTRRWTVLAVVLLVVLVAVVVFAQLFLATT